MADGSSETYGCDEFVCPAAIRNEVRFHVRSNGEILPVSICPLCCRDEDTFKNKGWGECVPGIADTTESSELTEGSSVSSRWA